jgi:hypothetical protein
MTHPDSEENIKLLHEKSRTEPALNFLGIKILEFETRLFQAEHQTQTGVYKCLRHNFWRYYHVFGR